jgi:hypothetical protein
VSTRNRADESGTRNAPSAQHGAVAMHAEDPAEAIANNPQERLNKEVRRRKFDQVAVDDARVSRWIPSATRTGASWRELPRTLGPSSGVLR